MGHFSVKIYASPGSTLSANQQAGINQDLALVLLGGFALIYQIRGGLKAVAMTDIVQVTLLVLGGLVVAGLTLGKIGGEAGIIGGLGVLMTQAPDHFHMILKPGDPHYKELPGLAVLIGGMWIANLSYWGFNQYIIQRALAAKNLAEAQRGIVLAAFIKLVMPVIIVLPGIAAVVLTPDLAKPDEAYPTMMRLLPPGLLGLVFAALIAAIIGSTASKINSIATIFTLDIYAKFKSANDAAPTERKLVLVGRLAALVSIVIAMLTARPLLGNLDQAFQYIQEFSGFVTPGITVIFLLGLFWPRATEAGALTGAIASVLLSFLFWFPAEWGGVTALNDVPFMNRMAVVFCISLLLAMIVSLVRPAAAGSNCITMRDVDFGTTRGFKVAFAVIVAILGLLYWRFW